MKTKLISILLIILLITIGISLYNNHRLKQQLNNAYTAHNQLNDTINRFKTVVSKYGDSLQVARQMILSQKQAIEMGLLREDELKDKYLKQVQVVIELKEQVTILEKQGEYIDTFYIETFKGGNWLKIPAKMAFSDPWYNVSVTADRTPLLDSLIVYSKPKLTLGYMKQGLFKRKERVTIYENENPYIELKDIQSLTIEEQKKWYQTTGAKIGFGALAGIIFTSVVTR
jgi:predicted RND superfamily exporter protein